MNTLNALFVGDSRQRLLDTLVESFTTVRTTGRPRCDVLSASLGHGKTKLVQELYRVLADTHQDTPAYWPADMFSSVSDEPTMTRRHVIHPRLPDVAVGALPPWLWWGVTCQDGLAGSPVLCLRNSASQLQAHVAGIEKRIARRKGIVSRGAGAVGELLGMLLPVGLMALALEALPAAGRGAHDLIVERRERSAGRAGARRVVDIERHGWARETEQYAEAIGAIVGSDLPLVLVLDGAHWADSGTVDLIDLLLRSDMPILIIATSWPEEIRRQSQHAIEEGPGSRRTFGSWISGALASGRQNVRLHELGALSRSDMSRFITEVAPATDLSVRDALLDRTVSPLFLRLLLESGKVTDAIIDRRIDLKPSDVHQLPASVTSLLLQQWNDFPHAVQRALVLASTQGQDFHRELVIVSASALSKGAAPDLDRVAAGWLQPVTDQIQRFTEPMQFDIVCQFSGATVEGDELSNARAAMCDRIAQMMADESTWLMTGERERRHLLQVLVGNERSIGDVLTFALACRQLSMLHGESHGWVLANHLIERALQDGVLAADLARDSELWRIRTLRELDRIAEALEDGERLLGTWEIELGSGDRDVGRLRLELGGARLAAGDAARAVEDFRAVVSSTHWGTEPVADAELRVLVAEALLEAGEPSEAILEIETVLRNLEVADISDDAAHYCIIDALAVAADAYFEAGDVTASVWWQRRLVARLTNRFGPSDPRTVAARSDLAVVLALGGSAESGRRLIEELRAAVGSEQTSGREGAIALASLGIAAILSGETDAGLRDLLAAGRELTELGGPDDPDATEIELLTAMLSVALGTEYQVGRLAELTRRVAGSLAFDPRQIALAELLSISVRHRLGEGRVAAGEVSTAMSDVATRSTGGFERALGIAIGTMVLLDMREYGDAARALDDARIWRDAGPLEPLLAALRTIALGAGRAGNPDAARQLLGIARGVEEPIFRALALTLASTAALHAGVPAAALEGLSEARLESTSVLGDRALSTLSVTALEAVALGRVRRPQDGLVLVRDVLDRADDLPPTLAQPVRLDAARAAIECDAAELALAVVDTLLTSASGVLDRDSETTLWRRCIPILRRAGHVEHALMLARRVVERESDTADPVTRRAGDLALARTLAASGEHVEARSVAEPIARELRQSPTFNAQLIEALNVLAEVFVGLQDPDQAVTVRSEAVDALVRHRAAGHPETLTARRVLAELLLVLGRHGEAAAQQRVVFDTRRAQFELTAPATITAAVNLAANLVTNGAPDEAVEVLEPIVAAVRELPEQPVELAFALDWLADAYQALGRTDAELDLRVARIEVHDDTVLDARRQLARRLYDLARYDEAARQERIVFDVRRAELGLAAPATIRAAGGLAVNLVKNGAPDEAVEVLEPIVAAVRELPEQPVELAFALDWLAEAYRALDRTDAELDLRVARIEVLAHHHGVDDDTVLDARRQLARRLYDLARYDEAARQERIVFDVRRSELGLAAPATITAAGDLAATLVTNGAPDEAVEVLEPIVAAVRELPEQPVELAVALDWLADAYQALDRTDAELDARVARIEVLAHHHGVDDDTVLDARRQLGVRQFQLAKYTHAIDQFGAEYRARVAKLGLTAPATIRAAGNLAANLVKNGAPDEAVEVLEPIVAAVRELPEQPVELAFALDWLAEAYRALDRTDAELDLRVARIEVLAHHHGVDDDTVLDARRQLGGRLYDLARYDEAARQERIVFDVRRSELGLAAPATITAAGGLAVNLVKNGAPDEAVEVLEPIVAAVRELPEQPVELAVALDWLAEAYRALDRTDAELDARVARIEVLAHHHGVDDDTVLDARRQLGGRLYDLAHYDEAARQERIVFDVRRSELGLTAPATFTAAGNLAATLVTNGAPDEAVEVLEPIVAAVRELPEQPVELAVALDWLADAYQALDRTDAELDARVARIEVLAHHHGVDDDTVLDARRQLGVRQFQLAKYTHAIDQFGAEYRARVAKLGLTAPATIRAAGNLAANLVKNGAPAEAVEVLEPIVAAVRELPEQPVELAFALDWLADAYHALDRTDAELDLRAARRLRSPRHLSEA